MRGKIKQKNTQGQTKSLSILLLPLNPEGKTLCPRQWSDFHYRERKADQSRHRKRRGFTRMRILIQRGH